MNQEEAKDNEEAKDKEEAKEGDIGDDLCHDRNMQIQA
jgi:hypothetical protein